jgi:LPPG:FO 2-phospho-L-lactate transferase
MSDDAVRTVIETVDGRDLEFQEYFVKERQEPQIAAVHFDGLEEALPGPEVIVAINEADQVIICPSNPIVSVGPILALPGVHDALRKHPRVTAVTPIVEGKALKGPAEVMLRASGADVSGAGVARLYSSFVDRFVVDSRDSDEIEAIERLGLEALSLDTVMTDHEASERLARSLL